MQSTLDFSSVILSSLQEKLDMAEAFPVVYNMTPHTMEQFVGSMFNRLYEKINTLMQDGGDELVAADDALGLALLLIRGGVKLPPDMLLDICKDIVKKSRAVAKYYYIGQEEVPYPGNAALASLRPFGIWYCKLFVNLNQDEEVEQ